MSVPYIALYPGDFLADTGHLGNTELGIYWRLLLVYYRDARPLPVDMDRLRRLAMTFSPEECRALESVLPEFFILTTRADGTRCWHHKRADIELNRATSAHNKKSEAAKATNAKRWGKGSLSDSLGESLSDIAKRPKSDGEPELEQELHNSSLCSEVVGAKPAEEAPRKRSAEPAKPRASRLPQDWALTKPLGEWAVQELGMKPEQVRTEAAKFADYWHAKAGKDATKADWPATWRNWCRKAVEDAARAPARPAAPESFRERDARIAAEQVKRLTGGLVHDRAALGESPKREPLPFERGYVAPATTADTIEGDANVRRIR